MTIFYSATTQAFYDSDATSLVPADAQEISLEYYNELRAGESQGKYIAPGATGMPELHSYPEPSYEDQLEQTKLNRQFAYRLDADPVFFDWQRGEATKEDWLAKCQEIKDANPYPPKPEGYDEAPDPNTGAV